jgi:serine/threonine protein kinase
VKVLDFGLAKLLDDTEAALPAFIAPSYRSRRPYGTATYAAPEQRAAIASTNARTSFRSACCFTKC